MYLNSRKIVVEQSFIFKRDDLLAITSLMQNTMFPGSQDSEIHVNCSLENRYIGGSLSALHKLNPQACINSFSISCQNGAFTYLTVEKRAPASNELAASISHPDLNLSLSLLDDFCRLFPFKN
ncbi:MAG: hypothetical protein WCP73_03675 [Eubacteriales bacterium]